MRLLGAVVPLAALLVLAAAPATAGTAELIERLPAETADSRAEIFGELVEGGESAVAELAGMLRDPEEGGDAKARYALHGLAVHVSRPGAQNERGNFARALVSRFGVSSSPEVRRFLVRQLLYAGGEESSAALARLLLDEELAEWAARSLSRIGEAAPLRDALAKSTGRARLQIIQGLGVLRDRQSVPVFKKAARDKDRDVRIAALFALAEAGELPAAGLMRDAAQSATGYERGQALAAFLKLADRVRDEGDKKGAEALYRELWEKTDGSGGHMRCAALRGLGELGGSRAMPELAKAQLTEDAEISAAAARIAASVPGAAVTQFWVSRAAPAGEADERVAALNVLGLRKKRGGLAAVRMALTSNVPGVRLAGAAAAGEMGFAEATPWLARLLESESGQERRAGREALLSLKGKDADSAIASLLAEAPARAKAGLLEVLAARVAVPHYAVAAGLTRDAVRDVRVAALKAVGVLGKRDSLSLMVDRALAGDDESELKTAAESFKSVCGREKERASCAGPVLAALPRAKVVSLAALLAMLPAAGGEAALEAVRVRIGHEDAGVKEAAVRALADWPDSSPADDLLALVRVEGAIKIQVLALRGYVRMAGEAGEMQAVRMLSAALEAAPRPEDVKLVLGAVADVTHAGALALALERLGDKDSSAEAAAAIVKIARNLGAGNTDVALAALKRVVKVMGKGRTGEKARETMDYVQAHGEFITTWMVRGKYLKAEEPEALIDVVFDPETAAKKEEGWVTPWQDPENDDPWQFNLNDAFWGENCAGYMRTFVYVATDMKARLEIGSDDGVKVWLNGEMVHRNNASRGVTDGEDKVRVRLKRGWNEIMLKVVNGGGDWGASLRVMKRSGKRIKGLKVARELPK